MKPALLTVLALAAASSCLVSLAGAVGVAVPTAVGRSLTGGRRRAPVDVVPLSSFATSANETGNERVPLCLAAWLPPPARRRRADHRAPPVGRRRVLRSLLPLDRVKTISYTRVDPIVSPGAPAKHGACDICRRGRGLPCQGSRADPPGALPLPNRRSQSTSSPAATRSGPTRRTPSPAAPRARRCRASTLSWPVPSRRARKLTSTRRGGACSAKIDLSNYWSNPLYYVWPNGSLSALNGVTNITVRPAPLLADARRRRGLTASRPPRVAVPPAPSARHRSERHRRRPRVVRAGPRSPGSSRVAQADAACLRSPARTLQPARLPDARRLAPPPEPVWRARRRLDVRLPAPPQRPSPAR